ncbi:MAG: right-handed parallel beta-helix repeat-containing protein [archaeon]
MGFVGGQNSAKKISNRCYLFFGILLLLSLFSSQAFAATLNPSQYATLSDMVDTHLNYYLSPTAVTSYGLPLGEYKIGSRTAIPWSNPTEWGYLLQAYIVAAERGKITKADAVARITTTLNTVKSLQDNNSQVWNGLFYPYYYVVNPSTGVDVAPYHTTLVNIPSIDDGLFYMSLLIVDGWAQDNGYTEISSKAQSIYSKMKFDDFIFTSGSKKYVSHVINATTGLPGTASGDGWNIYSDEGGLMVMIEYISGSVDFNTFKELINSQDRISSYWNGYEVKESAWFNSMFAWGVRSLAGIPLIDTFYSKESFVQTTKAHLAYGDYLGVDYPGFSDAMTQGFVGYYVPPTQSGQISVPAHSTPHAFFVPLNVLPDLDQNTLDKLMAKIVSVRDDNAVYYYGPGKTYPFGFVVATSLYANDLNYKGVKPNTDGKNVFETLSHAYITLSAFNALQYHDGNKDFPAYLAKIPGISSRISEMNLFLYPLTQCTDNDNDGYFLDGEICGTIDCNDGNSEINSGAIELCTDGIDNDCDGKIDSADPDCSTACVTPTAGMQITGSITFCKGTYSTGDINFAKDNLAVDCNGATIGSFSISGKNNITIRNCNLHGLNYDVSITNSNNVTIKDSNLLSTWDNGVKAISSSKLNIINNNISGNSYQSGIYFSSIFDSNIKNNNLKNNGLSSGSWVHAGAIALLNSGNIIVENNQASGNKRALYLTNSRQSKFTSNVFCSNNYDDYCASSANNTSSLNRITQGSVSSCSLLATQYLTCDQNCSDTDSGLDPATKGTVYFWNETVTANNDYCLDANTLNEYYCTGSALGLGNYNCQNGCSNGACLNIVCSTDAQCNDYNALTADTCVSPGTGSSYCTHTATTPACFSDANCGTNGYIGNLFCAGNQVVQVFRSFTCSNPGTANAACHSSDDNSLRNTCIVTSCSNGACLSAAPNPIFYESFNDLNSINTNNGLCGAQYQLCSGADGIAFVPGLKGNGVKFGGGSECSTTTCFTKQIAYSPSQQLSQGTIEFWVKPILGYSGTYNSALSGTGGKISIAKPSSATVTGFWQVYSGSDYSSSLPENSIGWHKAVYTWNSDTDDMNVYIDDKLLKQVNRDPTESISLKFGNPWISEVTNSTIDEAKVFDYIKTFDEIKQDYYANIPACLSDLECNDNDIFTLDKCINPGTLTSVCDNNYVVCSINSQCNDNNSLTSDFCDSINPNTGEKICRFDPFGVDCNSNSDCGTNGWTTDNAVCQSGNAYQNYKTYTCNNPGTINAACTNTTTLTLLESCPSGCSESYCVRTAPLAQKFMRGMNYVSWWYNQYEGADSNNSLQLLKTSTNSTWASVLVTQYLLNLSDTNIQSLPTKTPTDAGVVKAIQKIHSLGMKAALKPHVDVGASSSTWRGEITYSDEADWNKWFSSYKTFIYHYADIAQQNNVELFMIGTELKGTSNRVADWRSIIAGVRQRYSGSIVYAANHDEYMNVSWWPAVDYIGIDAYFPLTAKTNPTVQEMQTGFTQSITAADNFAKSYDKKIILTEIGYQSRDGANTTPWYSGGALDLQEQADAYQATLNVEKNDANIIGAFYWDWLTLTTQGGTTDTDYTVHGKPAETILANSYLGSFAADPPICNSNSECGTDGNISTPFCLGGNVLQTYRTFTCNNPGTAQASCSSSDTNQLTQTCSGQQTCNNGSCSTPVTCINPNDHMQVTSSITLCNQNQAFTDMNIAADNLVVDCNHAVIFPGYNGVLFNISDRNNVTIKNCNVIREPNVVVQIRDSKNITLVDNNFSSAWNSLINITHSSFITILNNDLFGSDYGATVYLSDVNDSLIQQNKLHDSGNSGSWYYAGGIYLESSLRNRILDNNIFGNTRAIAMQRSENNTFTNNNMCKNKHKSDCSNSISNTALGNKIGSDDANFCAFLANQSTHCSDQNCVDSDSGLKYYLKGSTTAWNGLIYTTLTDVCVDANILTEYYCENDFAHTGSVYPGHYCGFGCVDGACLNIACSSDSQCNDGNSSTTDTCINPGTTSSSCQYTPVVISCSTNAECGTNAWIGTNYCNLNNVWNIFRTFTCNNPGTVSSACVSSDLNQLRTSCSSAQICSGGACVGVTCSRDSDCGTDGFVNNPFCQGNDVVQTYRKWTCNSPGTGQSNCSSSNSTQVKIVCGTGQTCSNGACVSSYTYSWQTGAWSSCSVSCGAGSQTRNVYCKRNDGTKVADSYCSGTKPGTSQACDAGGCSLGKVCVSGQCIVKYLSYAKNEVMNLNGIYYHVNYALSTTNTPVWCNGTYITSSEGALDCGSAYGYTCYKASDNLVGCVKPCQSNTCDCASVTGINLATILSFTDSGIYNCGVGSEKRYVGSYISSPECGFFYYWKEIEDCTSSGRKCLNGKCV